MRRVEVVLLSEFRLPPVAEREKPSATLSAALFERLLLVGRYDHCTGFSSGLWGRLPCLLLHGE